MKKLIITPYLFIVFIVWFYMCNFGNYSYKSKPYNLGRAVFWPVSLFSEDPEIDGSSISTFYNSFGELLSAHDEEQGRINAIEAIGQISILKYVEDNKSLTKNDINNLIYDIPTSSKSFNNIIESLYSDPSKLNEFLCKKLDGYDYHDLISEGKSSLEDLKEIAEDRTN